MGTLPTHYQGSRGAVEIASMVHSHLVNAHAKLAREGDPDRAPEVEAMAAQIAINDAGYAEAQAASADTGEAL